MTHPSGPISASARLSRSFVPINRRATLYLDNIARSNRTSLSLSIRSGQNLMHQIRLVAHEGRLFAIENHLGLADMIEVTEITDGMRFRGAIFKLPGRIRDGNTLDVEVSPALSHNLVSCEINRSGNPQKSALTEADQDLIMSRIRDLLGLNQPETDQPQPNHGLGLGSRLGVNLRLTSTPAAPAEVQVTEPQAIAPGYQQVWPVAEGQGLILSARDEARSYYTIVRNNDRYSIINTAAATRIADIGLGEYMALSPAGLVVRIDQAGQIIIENRSAYEVTPQPMISNHVNPSLRQI